MDDLRPNGIRATYRSLLLRGLDPGEAANVTAFLNGLPSAGLRWNVVEVEALVRQRTDQLRRSFIEELTEAPPLTRQSS